MRLIGVWCCAVSKEEVCKRHTWCDECDFGRLEDEARTTTKGMNDFSRIYVYIYLYLHLCAIEKMAVCVVGWIAKSRNRTTMRLLLKCVMRNVSWRNLRASILIGVLSCRRIWMERCANSVTEKAFLVQFFRV